MLIMIIRHPEHISQYRYNVRHRLSCLGSIGNTTYRMVERARVLSSSSQGMDHGQSACIFFIHRSACVLHAFGSNSNIVEPSVSISSASPMEITAVICVQNTAFRRRCITQLVLGGALALCSKRQSSPAGAMTTKRGWAGSCNNTSIWACAGQPTS